MYFSYIIKSWPKPIKSLLSKYTAFDGYLTKYFKFLVKENIKASSSCLKPYAKGDH